MASLVVKNMNQAILSGVTLHLSPEVDMDHNPMNEAAMTDEDVGSSNEEVRPNKKDATNDTKVASCNKEAGVAGEGTMSNTEVASGNEDVRLND